VESHPEPTGSIFDGVAAVLPQIAAAVIKKAKETGTPVIIWEDEQVKAISPEELERRWAASVAEKNR
jgi:hypothetical protein